MTTKVSNLYVWTITEMTVNAPMAIQACLVNTITKVERQNNCEICLEWWSTKAVIKSTTMSILFAVKQLSTNKIYFKSPFLHGEISGNSTDQLVMLWYDQALAVFLSTSISSSHPPTHCITISKKHLIPNSFSILLPISSTHPLIVSSTALFSLIAKIKIDCVQNL